MSEFLGGYNQELTSALKEETSPDPDQAAIAVESQSSEPQLLESQLSELLEKVLSLVEENDEVKNFIVGQNWTLEELTYLHSLLQETISNNSKQLTKNDLVRKLTQQILATTFPQSIDKKDVQQQPKGLALSILKKVGATTTAALLAFFGPAAFKDHSASASAKSKAPTSTTETVSITASAEETPQMLSGAEVKLLTAYSNAKNYLDQYDALYSFLTLSDSQFKLFTEMLDYGIDDDEKNDPQFESLSLYYAQVLASLDRAEIERLTLLLQETTEKKWELYEAIFSAYGNEVLGYWEFSHQFEQSYWESEEAFQELDELYEHFLAGKKLLKKAEELKNWEEETFDLLEEWSMKHKEAAIAAGFIPITEPPQYRAPTWNFTTGKPD